MSMRRTFRTEVAPTVYLATDAVAIVDYTDDGEPAVRVVYNHRSHRFEHEDGSRCEEALWPALRACMRDVKRGLEDPHNEAVEAWADSIYDQIEAQRTSVTEAPVFSGERDQRRSDQKLVSGDTPTHLAPSHELPTPAVLPPPDGGRRLLRWREDQNTMARISKG